MAPAPVAVAEPTILRVTERCPPRALLVPRSRARPAVVVVAAPAARACWGESMHFDMKQWRVADSDVKSIEIPFGNINTCLKIIKNAMVFDLM